MADTPKFDKPYIEKLPIFNFPKYEPDYDSDLVVVIPLFKDERNTLSAPFSSTEFQLHCHSAVWAAACLLRNSDFLARRIPIYFYVQKSVEVLSSAVFDYFDVCGRHRMLFDTNGWENQFDLNTAPLGWKLSPLFDERLMDHQTIMLLDSDMYLSVPNQPVNLYEQIKLLDFETVAFWTANDPAPVDFYAIIHILSTGLGIDDFDRTEPFKTQMTEIMKKAGHPSVNRPQELYHINSSLTLYNLSDPDLHEFLMAFYKRSGQDENLFISYYYMYPDVHQRPFSIENKMSVRQYFDQNAVIGHYLHGSTNPFFSHVHVFAGEQDRTDEYMSKLYVDLTRNF